MSTDVYIDVFDRHDRRRVQEAEPFNDEGEVGEWAGVVDTLRLGHVTPLRDFAFNWYEWLLHYACATNLLTSVASVAVLTTHTYLLRSLAKMQAFNPDWVAIRYGVHPKNVQFNDVALGDELASFLAKHVGQRWRVRID